MQSKSNVAPPWLTQYTEDQAREILELQDRVRDLERERDSYRELLLLALDALSRLTIAYDRLREQNRELRRSLMPVISDDRRAA